MGCLLAIDYGLKRCGLATTDSLQLIASGLCTVRTHELIDFLKNFISKEPVDALIVGEPRQMNNTPSDMEVPILQFLKRIKTIFPLLPIHRVDERFTSKMALSSLLNDGTPKMKRREKGLVDEVSATLILQSYLYQQEKQKLNSK